MPKDIVTNTHAGSNIAALILNNSSHFGRPPGGAVRAASRQVLWAPPGPAAGAEIGRLAPAAPLPLLGSRLPLRRRRPRPQPAAHRLAAAAQPAAGHAVQPFRQRAQPWRQPRQLWRCLLPDNAAALLWHSPQHERRLHCRWLCGRCFQLPDAAARPLPHLLRGRGGGSVRRQLLQRQQRRLRVRPRVHGRAAGVPGHCPMHCSGPVTLDCCQTRAAATSNKWRFFCSDL